MLKLTNIVDMSTVIRSPNEFINSNFKVADITGMRTIFSYFDTTFTMDLSVYPKETPVCDVKVNTPYGRTIISNISEGAAICIIAKWAVRNKKRVQFLSGSINSKTGKLLTKIAEKTDLISVYLQNGSEKYPKVIISE